MRIRFLFAALLAPAFLLSACGGSAPDVEHDSGSGAEVPFTGTDVGYVTALHEAGEDGLRSMEVDLIEWYTGTGAVAAAKRDDPECVDPCEPPNGFYIRNARKDPFTFDVANDVRVFLQTRNPAKLVPDEEVLYEDFLKVIRDPSGRVTSRFQVTPFWITHEDGVITQIKEQYVP